MQGPRTNGSARGALSSRLVALAPVGGAYTAPFAICVTASMLKRAGTYTLFTPGAGKSTRNSSGWQTASSKREAKFFRAGKHFGISIRGGIPK